MDVTITISLTDRAIVADITAPFDPAKNTRITMEYDEGIPTDRLGLTQALTAVAREAALQLSK